MEEIETFYQQIEDALKITKHREIMIVMGYFNANIGKGENGKNVRKHGVGENNETGERLLQFCKKKSQIRSLSCQLDGYIRDVYSRTNRKK